VPNEVNGEQNKEVDDKESKMAIDRFVRDSLKRKTGDIGEAIVNGNINAGNRHS
jgi:hypothetical protein